VYFFDADSQSGKDLAEINFRTLASRACAQGQGGVMARASTSGKNYFGAKKMCPPSIKDHGKSEPALSKVGGSVRRLI
jgi:hypothetical protein